MHVHVRRGELHHLDVNATVCLAESALTNSMQLQERLGCCCTDLQVRTGELHQSDMSAAVSLVETLLMESMQIKPEAQMLLHRSASQGS